MEAQTPNETQGQKAIVNLEAPERWGVKLPPRLAAIPLSDSTARLVEIRELTLFIAELYGDRAEASLRAYLHNNDEETQKQLDERYSVCNERALKALNPFLELIETELEESFLDYISCPYKENAEA
jgi:hypothetical protein